MKTAIKERDLLVLVQTPETQGLGSAIKNYNEPSIDGESEPYKLKRQLWSHFSQLKVKLPSELFDHLGPNDSLEMWDDKFNLLFILGKVLDRSSYTLMELTSSPWHQLFEREKDFEEKLVEAYVKTIETSEPQFDVCGWHTVRERRSRFLFEQQVRVKLMAPWSVEGTKGIFAIIETRRPRSFVKTIRQWLLALIGNLILSLKSWLQPNA